MNILYKKTNSSLKHRNNVLSALLEANWVKYYLESLIKICYINNKPYSMIDIERINGFPTSLVGNYPKSLFKFFPNTSSKDEAGNPKNYSFDALCTNKIFMQNPQNYNDPYDAYFHIDRDEFVLKRLQFYLSISNIPYSENEIISDLIFKLATKVYEHLKQNQYKKSSLDSLFKTYEDNEKKTFLTQVFSKNLNIYFNSSESNKDEYIYYNAVDFAIYEEYMAAINKDYLNFKIACFSTEYNSMLMWSHYANSHKGFCVEYDLLPNDKYQDLYSKLFPVIYCDYISDMTQDMLDNYINGITDNFMWGIYNKGLLRKSTAWKYENEWRFVTPCSGKDPDAPHHFFPIKKIYLGKNMPAKERKIIIDFCNSNKPIIPYCGLKLDRDKYEMATCEQLCEDCSSFQRRLNEIVIKELQYSDLQIKQALDLVLKVFNKFEAPDYSQQGIDTFYKFIEQNSISNKLQNNQLKIWAAFKDNEIVGVIATRDINHISLFFVDTEHHKQGIGKMLFIAAMSDITINKLSYITVNSSPYAVPIYHHLGFKDTDIAQIADGVKFTPMEYDLSGFYLMD